MILCIGGSWVGVLVESKVKARHQASVMLGRDRHFELKAVVDKLLG